MHVFRTWSEVPAALKGGVIALGNFDGLHLGHQAVIGRAVDLARTAGVAAAVMTFEPHPRMFFKPDQEPFRLSPFRMKAHVIEALGVDYLYVQSFDKEFSQRTPENFVSEILVGGLGLSHIVVGYDYVFGYQRTGNVAVLRDLAAKYGFGVTAVEKLGEGEERFSSTAIRDLLREGRPRAAARMLGRFWEIEGRVVTGDKRGRQLGFPTANLEYRDYLHPKKGVYAVRAGVDHGAGTVWRNGVANFGNRPTFDKTDVLLEAHLFDTREDLYGKHLRVALIDYIRAEEKFDGLEALKIQIAADSRKARELLTTAGFPADPAPFVSYGP
ncbi:MAG: bifunctional riboflavin kinase/FAD synthetase [Proteobacteria bacterium]|nr:bifunctional riboflavin kinase/FAD synthetase [Pseudomonadota bacterium]